MEEISFNSIWQKKISHFLLFIYLFMDPKFQISNNLLFELQPIPINERAVRHLIDQMGP
jgi:hypothetical protein